MPNNPVQIVLNAQNYVQRIENPPGGGYRDFYAGRDEDFAAHKRSLLSQVADLQPPKDAKASLQYACVEFSEGGWAKSHRPNQALFPAKKIRTLGGNELGTVVVEVTPDDLRSLPDRIKAAEETTTWRPKKNNPDKLEAKPSRIRSEIGAIKKIRLYGPQDRRKFTLDQALAWLSDPRTGGAYYVETFISHKRARRKVVPNEERERLALALLAQFENGLSALDKDVQVTPVDTHWSPGLLFVVKVSRPPASAEGRALHRKLLQFLDQQDAVRSILLPPVLQSSEVADTRGSPAKVPAPEKRADYPVVGIIDTGVADLKSLEAWSAGGVEFINDAKQDRSHGTFIAGLLTAGGVLNAGAPFDERPCKFFDLGLHPTANYGAFYPRGFLDFLDQLDVEIKAAKKAGVRIFNMSLSVSVPVEDINYSFFAHALDRIADQHGVLFVLPAGNLQEAFMRREWPDAPDDCLKMLAEYRHQGKDRILQPADSLRSLVVGALDPPDDEGATRPSRYTRRGPGPSLGAKPDLAHIGGRAGPDHGLVSVAPDGKTVTSCGTSFAAPFVAKTLAVIDQSIAGSVSLETLCALAIHSADQPTVVQDKRLVTIAKDFVGAGTPRRAVDVLEVADSQITLIFNGSLKRGEGLSFDFTWPESLMTDKGACRGSVQLTTVYRPPIDREYGAEFVLLNLDPWLKQAQVDKDSGEITYHNRLKTHSEHGIEKERVEFGAKWWPAKRFSQTFRGVGHSSQWRLAIEPLCRSEYQLGDDQAVEFCAILTIADNKGTEPIFNEVRKQLRASGVKVEDVRVALSPQLRARG